jgi:DNA-binding transcriptional LysR family regulator
MADRRLLAFHTVAKHLSFTKAAEALCMTQPAVTFQIRQLEEHFNTRLFDRGNGRIQLTRTGVVALEYVDRILALYGDLDEKVRELTGQEGGVLMIGASTTIAEFLLPKILGEFKARHPGIVPQLIVAHRGTLVTDICCEDELQVVCSPSHPLARCKVLAVNALTEHQYISREVGSGTREVIDRHLENAGLASDSLQIVMEASSPEALKRLVATGLGFAIMSRVTAEKEVRLGDLVQIPLVPPLVRHLAVVYTRERIHSLAVNEFVRFAKAELAENALTRRQLITA